MIPLNVNNPFETTRPTPEPGLYDKVRLIARVDIAMAIGALAVWAYVGAVPATTWGALAIVVALVGTMTFGAASLIGWIRLPNIEREKEWIALSAGLFSFAIGLIIMAFYAASLFLM